MLLTQKQKGQLMDPAVDAMVQVKVDQALCIGGGQCEMLEPEMFLVDDDEAISSVIGDGWLPLSRATVLVERCPGQAIVITKHSTDKDINDLK